MKKVELPKILKKGCEKLFDYCVNEGFTHIICTHVLSSLMISKIKNEKGFNAKTYFVATDYDCSPGVLDTEMDKYFIPDDCLKEEFKNKSTIDVGIPIRSEFYNKLDKNEAKKSLGLDESNNHILVMFGSMGCGPTDKLVKLLIENLYNNTCITVLCGSNKNLYEKLKNKYGNNKNVRIHTFVDNLSLLMSSSDIYITKPGGIGTTEAMAKGLPMVLFDIISSYEYKNLLYFNKIANVPSSDNVFGVVNHCISLVKDENKRKEISDKLLKNSKNASKEIFNYIKSTS